MKKLFSFTLVVLSLCAVLIQSATASEKTIIFRSSARSSVLIDALKQWPRCWGGAVQVGYVIGIPNGGSTNYSDWESGEIKSFKINIVLQSGKIKTVEVIGQKWPLNAFARSELFSITGKYGLWYPVVKVPRNKKKIYYYDVFIIGRIYSYGYGGKYLNEEYPTNCQ